MSARQRWLALGGVAVLAAVLAWAWQAYFTPAMMIDLANLRLCL